MKGDRAGSLCFAHMCTCAQATSTLFETQPHAFQTPNIRCVKRDQETSALMRWSSLRLGQRMSDASTATGFKVMFVRLSNTMDSDTVWKGNFFIPYKPL